MKMLLHALGEAGERVDELEEVSGVSLRDMCIGEGLIINAIEVRSPSPPIPPYCALRTYASGTETGPPCLFVC